jgi:hypothetical protein
MYHPLKENFLTSNCTCVLLVNTSLCGDSVMRSCSRGGGNNEVLLRMGAPAGAAATRASGQGVSRAKRGREKKAVVL